VVKQFDLQEHIQKYGKLKEESGDKYFNAVIDFFKWTTTFAFAALIWIGTNFHNYPSNSFIWFYVSIFSIVISIVISIVTTYLILNRWNYDWSSKFQLHNLLTMTEVNEKHPNAFSVDEMNKQRKLVLEASSTMFVQKRFDKYLIFHIVFLFLGLIFYIFAMLT
jgi:hypothetical protein